MVRMEEAVELIAMPATSDPTELLAVHELLDRLAAKYPRKAEVVKLRYFLGCSQKETAHVLGITEDTAQDDWVFARAWLSASGGRERLNRAPGLLREFDAFPRFRRKVSRRRNRFLAW